jgi:TatD DNase family protein
MENAEELIRKSAENDIHLIVNGTDPQSNMEVLNLAAGYNNVHAALGYFHTLADDITDDDIDLLDSQLRDGNVVAVGEIGIDYYYTKENRDKQKELFDEMLNLAEKHNLPAIVHCRKAMQDTFDILSEHDVRGSMHCYQGSGEMALRFINQGFYIGVGGPVTQTNNKKIKRMLEKIDIGNVVVETDSPYLPPEAKTGMANTPMNITLIIEKIAEKFDMDYDEAAEITAENAKRLFQL